MPKVAKLPSKQEQLAWCREARTQNVAALREHETRRIAEGDDSALPYIRMLHSTIAALDEQITELEKHA